MGIHDTIELSLARWRFGLSDTVPGQSIDMDIVGAKWRVWGDALHDQDRWWPQVALGFQHKRNRSMAVPTALGARRASDTEPYASATKLWLGGLAGHNVLGNLTLRATRANQFGLLGFGGDLGERRRLHPEASLAVLLRDDLALGAEWRSKPSNLGVFGEQSAHDVFLAWFPTRHLNATLSSEPGGHRRQDLATRLVRLAAGRPLIERERAAKQVRTQPHGHAPTDRR